MKRTKLIIIEETYERLILRAPRTRIRFRCTQCLTKTDWIDTGDATRLAGVSEREIHRLLGEGRIHFCETSEGGTLICEASLRSLLADR